MGQWDGTQKCINEEVKTYELKEQPKVCVNQIILQPIHEGVFKDFACRTQGR